MNRTHLAAASATIALVPASAAGLIAFYLMTLIPASAEASLAVAGLTAALVACLSAVGWYRSERQ